MDNIIPIIERSKWRFREGKTKVPQVANDDSGVEPEPLGPKSYALFLWHTAIPPLSFLGPGRADFSRVERCLCWSRRLLHESSRRNEACLGIASCLPLREKGGKETRSQKWRLRQNSKSYSSWAWEMQQ